MISREVFENHIERIGRYGDLLVLFRHELDAKLTC